MKGVVLAEFVQFAESRFRIPPPQAQFNAVERYRHADLAALVDDVAAKAGTTGPEVLKSFGSHLFGRFVSLYPVFFVDAGSAMDLLGRINTYVHGEVQKIYPDAEFPRFDVEGPAGGRLELVYRSNLPLADLAEGLIRGCIAHFGEQVTVRREDLAADGRAARFVMESQARPPRRREAS